MLSQKGDECKPLVPGPGGAGRFIPETEAAAAAAAAGVPLVVRPIDGNTPTSAAAAAAAAAADDGRGLHSFTLELNLINPRTHS